MEKKFYLIESSSWSNDGTLNPVVHAVVYATADTLMIKVLDFLQRHLDYVSDRESGELDVCFLTESSVDARLVSVIRMLGDKDESDVAFDCPEWCTSYRIREVSVSGKHWRSLRVQPNHRIVLGIDFKNTQNGNPFDFETENPSVRPEHLVGDGATIGNREHDEMNLILNEFSIEGWEW